MRTTLTTLTLLLLGVLSAVAQNESMETPASNEKTYELTAMVGGGYSRDVSSFEDSRNDLSLNRNQFSLFGRVMWRPGNLLSGGLEFGYMNFYSVSNNNGGKAVRNAIPLFLLFSMSPFDGLDVTVGYGFAFMGATVEGNAGSVSSSTSSTALMAALSYRYPVTDKLQIGGEARFSNFDHLDDRTISISAVVSYLITSY